MDGQKMNLLKSTLAVLAMFVSTAWAGEITATNPAQILKAMQEYGFTVTMEKDSDGDPKIVGQVSRTKFRVYFFGCTNNKDCGSLHFRAGYDQEGVMSALKVNEWNREKRFTKAYIDDEGDPFMEMDVNLDFDGVGVKNFEDTLDWWRLLVEDFEDFIEW